MKARPSIFIALRMLRGRSGASGNLAGAIAGIAMSLVPLILVMTVSDGMIGGITERYLETGTYHIQIELPPGFGTGPGDPAESEALAEVQTSILRIEGVRSVWLETQGAGVLASPGSTHATALRAVAPAFFSDPGAKSLLSLSEGSRPPSRANEILLGEALAESLGVRKGGMVTLMTRRSGKGTGMTDTSSVPRLGVFKVSGTVSAGYRELDALWAFLSPEAAAGFLGTDAERSFLGIKTGRPYGAELDTIRASADSIMRKRFPAWYEPGYTRTWKEAERGLFRSFSTTKSILAFIMAIAVLVAAINLGSSLAAFAAERRTDIAVLKSTGASPRKIASIFLAAGLATGTAGTVAGIAVGMVASWRVNDLVGLADALLNLVAGMSAGGGGKGETALKLLDPGYYLPTIPIVFDPVQIAVVAGSSVLLCALASAIPAHGASKMPPMELLRKI